MDRPLAPLDLGAEGERALQSLASRRTTAQALALRARIVLACAAGEGPISGLDMAMGNVRSGGTRRPSNARVGDQAVVPAASSLPASGQAARPRSRQAPNVARDRPYPDSG